MSHDLRTPFSGILGFTHQLYTQEADAHKKQQLGYIIESAENLLNLLNDILAASQDGTQHQFIMSTFDVLVLLRQIQSLFSAEVERKKLVFTVVDDDKPVIIMSDKHRLHRILINLISNAIKFTEEGEITVSVFLRESEGQTYLKLKVADTGEGIAASDFANIFERFTRLSSSHEGQFTGAGIGLWLAKTFVEDLGGEIDIHSQPGQGATFSCDIPVKVASMDALSNTPDASLAPAVQPTVVDAPQQQLTHKQLKILMVEDHELTRLAQRNILESLGWQVDIASDASSAYTMATKLAYDLIIMDIGLPDMNGFDAAAKIRSDCPLNQTTPTLGLTAHLSQSEQQHCQRDSIDKLLLKPLRQSTCEMIDGWLAGFPLSAKD